MCVIRVGGEAAEYLAITVTGHRSPHLFVDIDVNVVAGRFRGTQSYSLIDYELAAFRDGLTRLLDGSQGEAIYHHHSDWFTLAVRSGRRGEVEVCGTLRDGEFGNERNALTFRLDLDQTYLRPMLDGLNEVIARYPSTFDHRW